MKCSHLWLMLSGRGSGPRMVPGKRAQQCCGCWRPRETEWCKGGMRGEVFSRMSALGFYQGNGTPYTCPGKGNERVRDGWEASDLAEFRSMCKILF